MPKSFTYEVLTEDTPRKMYSGHENNGNTIPESNFPNGTSLSTTVCQCQQLRATCPSPTCRRKAMMEVRDFNDANNIPTKNSLSITLQNDSNEHCHDDELREEFDKKARKKLWIASILCVVFMIGEAVGGILAGSLAVATDAAHLLTDFAGFMISLFALYMAQRPATKRLSYGYHRAEVIGALTSVLLIWVVTGILVYMAVQRVVSQDFEIDAPIMLITSGVGLIVNIIMGCTLHQHSHGPGGGSHGHSHGGGGHGHSHGPGADVEASSSSSASTPTSESSYKPHKVNINVRAAFIHVIGDFIQSVGVFAAALVIYFKKEWVIVDPICTFLFSLLVLATTYSIIKDALVVLMEGIPQGIDFNEVREALVSIKGVYKVHNLRIWSLSMDRMALSAHLAIHPTSGSSNSILKKASTLVRNRFGFSEVTIQIEEFSESMQDCIKCQELN